MLIPCFRRVVVVALLALGACQSPATCHIAEVVVDCETAQLSRRVDDAIHAHRYEEAEKLLLKLTALQPQYSGAWTNLGALYIARDEAAAAWTAFENALEANPSNCAARVNLGVLARRAGDYEAAETYYLSCARPTSDLLEAYLNLGILYEVYMGRLDDALEAYRAYQRAVPAPNERVAMWVRDLEFRTEAMAR